MWKDNIVTFEINKKKRLEISLLLYIKEIHAAKLYVKWIKSHRTHIHTSKV